MKKILATTALVLFASQTIADNTKFYAKGSFGGSIFTLLPEDKSKLTSTDKLPLSVDEISDIFSNGKFFGAGLGYRISDNMRVEITANHFPGIKFYLNPENKDNFVELTATPILLNGFYDFANFGPVKLFAGAGVGVNIMQFKGQQNVTSLVNTTLPNGDSMNIRDTISTVATSSKSKYSLAYAVHLGTSFDLRNDFEVDLTLSYRDLGKTFFDAYDQEVRVSGKKVGERKDVKFAMSNDILRGVTASIGIRYNF